MAEISPVVLAAGRVAGVWNVEDGTLTIRLFPEAGKIAHKSLEVEAERITRFTGWELRVSVQSALMRGRAGAL